MCGIAGIYAYHYAAPQTHEAELLEIREAMKKRGPDAGGLWRSPSGAAAFAHRRLSILDLSDAGLQPMSSEDGDLVITFNGEIYNYKELRAELEKKGRKFRSNTDTEVLLHLYAEKGKAMLADLRGMFAFGIWDNKKRCLLLARDPHGIKPLYYADDGWSVRFASQVRALLASGKVSRAPEPAGIAGFFLTGCVPEPFTFYQEIREVPAGSSVTVEESGPGAPEPYFSLAELYKTAGLDPVLKNDAEARELLREALLESVRYHFVSDVPVGIFLSAGIDSGVLLALAQEAGIPDLRTVTLAFEEFKDSRRDEGPLAEETAKLYGAKHQTRFISRAEFEKEIPAILASMDQPSIDGINTYYTSKAIAETGLKVVLSGVGADEIFGGYPTFNDVPMSAAAAAIPSRIPGLGDFFAACASPKDIRQLKVAGLLKYGKSWGGAYRIRQGLFMPWELSRFVGAEMAREGLRRLDFVRRTNRALTPGPGNNYARVSVLESSFYLREQLLKDADWASMAHSVELRTPYVDPFFLRKALQVLLPLSHTKKSFKDMLASLPAKSLPEGVRRREKSGFSLPMREWIAQTKTYDDWQNIPELAQKDCSWARRWAYSVYKRFAGDK